ncbi:MAG: hypothetical protein KDK24_06975 [Pseudooceanicola sp.]|nr:hypothetical protein [Pseudooceanicola sp.]
MSAAIDLIRAARVPMESRDWIDGNRNCRRRRTGTLGPVLGCNSYVVLCEANLAGLHMVEDDGWGGHIIMEDSPREIRKHLPILIHGTGRILKTGLGLGCVVRGLLSKSDVAHIDVIENDPRIIRHVGPEFAGNSRVTIHQGDALTLDIDGRWDFAWHDIYTEGNDGLQVLHGKLIKRYYGRARVQGAWNFPASVARALPIRLLGAKRTRRQRR